MQIAIFNEITTEEALQQLERSAEKYDGLYVDMNNKDERKFVKDKAYDIQQLLKAIDRKRIDESKEYKTKVEAEASAIKQRLEDANSPFMILINNHKEERAKILSEEKAIKEAEELAIQIEIDHADAIMYNKVYAAEKAELLAAQNKRDEDIKAEAIEQATAKAERYAVEAEEKRLHDVKQAKQEQINKQNAEQQRIKDEESARLANQSYVTATCKAAKEALIQFAGLTEDQAVSAVKAIRDNKISNVTLNF